MDLCLFHQNTCLVVLLVCSATSVTVLPNVSWLFFAFYNIFVNFHTYDVRIGHFKHGLQQQLFLQENRGKNISVCPLLHQVIFRAKQSSWKNSEYSQTYCIHVSVVFTGNGHD